MTLPRHTTRQSVCESYSTRATLQQKQAKEQKPEDSEYVKALVAQMEKVVEKINHQNERYDVLNKKLSEIETSKDDEEVRERLVKDNQETAHK
jgi:hypothetical protein